MVVCATRDYSVAKLMHSSAEGFGVVNYLLGIFLETRRGHFGELYTDSSTDLTATC